MVEDRWCRAGALDNRLRRRFLPPGKDLDRLGVRPGQDVCDLGAGVGYFADEILRRLGPAGHLVLVDPDRENLGPYLERHGPDPRVTSWFCSAADVDAIPSESQDRVLLSLVLCCLVEKAAVLDQTWRILRPTGRALVTYPAWGVPFRRESLRVRPELWRTLVSRRPWRVLSSERSWGIARHLLEKTGPELRPSAHAMDPPGGGDGGAPYSTRSHRDETT